MLPESCATITKATVTSEAHAANPASASKLPMGAPVRKMVIPHQANLRIIESVMTRSGIPRERTFINIERTANTSSASVPIALDQAVRTGKVQPGQNVVFCALGGGFAWGSAMVRW